MPEAAADPGWGSLLPPLLAIALAVRTRHVVASLFFGLWLGVAMLNQWNPLRALWALVADFAFVQVSDPWNLWVLVLMLCIGGFVRLVVRSGGAAAFAERLSRAVTTRARAQLAVWLGGIAVFFSDSANPLILGPLYAPLFDRLKLSREKLAYLIDSTASPICILVPITSWAAYVLSLLGREIADLPVDATPTAAYLGSIPFQFYPLASLALVPLIGRFGLDFGPMAQAEERKRREPEPAHAAAAAATPAPAVSSATSAAGAGGLAALAVTAGVILAVLLASGGFPAASLLAALAAGNSVVAVTCGFVAGAVVLAAVLLARRAMPAGEIAACWGRGAAGMGEVLVILVLAWSLGACCDALGTGAYVAGVVERSVSPLLVPALVFLVGAVISFATGSAWGCYAIMMPIAIPLAVQTGSPLPVVLAAVLSGGIFGDHCSPISDTTILSSMGAGCEHVEHVRTQLPYAAAAGVAALAGFLVVGAWATPWAVVLVAALLAALALALGARRTVLAILLLTSTGTIALADTREPVDHVDPFIGTGGHGHTFPGATLPFGMVQLSPDTRLTGWDGSSGYHWTDDVVYGFSHTHLSGTGISDYGDVLLMPVTGTPRLDSGYGGDPDSGYGSRFDKKSERAGAGWYAVGLADYRIGVELTATERAGFHRYRFPANEPAHVVVDLEHRDEVLDSELRLAGDREIAGFRRSTGWARDQIVYFVARFSRPFVGTELVLDGRRGAGSAGGGRRISGQSVKAVLSFGNGGGELLVKVGLSAVDVDGARRNLEAEIPGWSFDDVRRAARRRWSSALGKIEVEGDSPELAAIFYTALYHSLLAPNTFSDVDGRYRGMDREIHRAFDRRHYTVFSLWDTFRATHPLFTLIEPGRASEMIRTFLAQYEQGGRLPVWELAANETDTMIGYHSVSVIADAWLKGIRGFDAGRALDAMLDSAERDHFGLDAYRRQGFIGSEDDGESVSKTLEYAYDDACIARMAAELGRDELARRFARRSQAWRHLLDPATGFMRARRNQRWLEPFDPRRIDNHYTEANAWQYSFFVPHDVPGLIAALGGDERFVARLDALFSAPSETTGRDQPDVTGLVGQYAHGNEPSHHVAWLYHYAGRPDRSADRVRHILESLYAATPDGLAGNEDCGQMSSWFVLAALGLYPVAPCSDEYLIASPLFARATLDVGGGRRFTIRAPRGDSGDRYVRSAELDGRPLDRSFLRHGEIAAGGELVLHLGPRPGAGWGVAARHRPGPVIEAEPVMAAPFARAEADVFRDSLTVELDSADPEAVIRFAATPPAAAGEGDAACWRTYRGPIVLGESTRLEFVAEARGRSSPVVAAVFHRIPHDWRVEVLADASPQYTAGGPIGLIDGRRGGRNWRTGFWQGYQGTDFEAILDLGTVRPLARAGAGFLQDVRSWIWMPVELVLAVSTDGERYREVARLTGGVADDAMPVVTRDLVAELGGVEARYLRLFARSYGKIPAWHPGRGHDAWIFVDEILVE